MAEVAGCGTSSASKSNLEDATDDGAIQKMQGFEAQYRSRGATLIEWQASLHAWHHYRYMDAFP